MHVEGDVLPARASLIDDFDAAQASRVVAAWDQVADLQLDLGVARNADHLFDRLGGALGAVARMRGEELARPAGFARERGELFLG